MVVSDSVTAADFQAEVVAEIDSKMKVLNNAAQHARPQRLAQITHTLDELRGLRGFLASVVFSR